MNDLASRSANYTDQFSVPKTSKNIRALGYLTVPGNTSNIPYQKNECSLYSADTGECFVYKGWARITDGEKSFNIAVYDGGYDFFKNIENKNLSQLTLTDLLHPKTVATVVNTWANPELPYRYILADYNGDTGRTNIDSEITVPEINIDYLVPSVNVAWLWRKIFEEYNFGVQPTGAIFDTEAFKNLWMTYPKGLPATGDGVDNHVLLHSNDYSFVDQYLQRDTGRYFYHAHYNSVLVDELYQVDGINMTMRENATYQLEIKCTLFGFNNFGQQRDAAIAIGKNAGGRNPLASFTTHQLLQNGATIFGAEADVIPYGVETTLRSAPFQLNGLEAINIAVTGSAFSGSYQLAPIPQGFEVTLVRIDPLFVDFSIALSDFLIKDFISEIVHRFALTMFTKKVGNDIEFLTLHEQLQTPEIVNWSSKFSDKLTENYISGSYAQRNWLRYNYNDKEGSYNDGVITVDNVNLQDSKDSIKSKIYSPDKEGRIYLNESTNVYPVWEKEYNENPSPDEPVVTYKSLDKRYYFMRSRNAYGNAKIYSKKFEIENTVNNYYRETFYGLPFQDIVNDYYQPLQNILQKAVIVTAKLWFKDTDIAGFDFKKLYYIEQLSNYYLVNKIIEYIPGQLTKCELVKVQYASVLPPVEIPWFVINTIVVNGRRASIYFTRNVQLAGHLLISTDGVNFTAYGMLGNFNPYVTRDLDPGNYFFRIYDEHSNTVEVTIV
ncbi:hypothetical protein [Flavobacterium rivuli]|uniref:hypothetical protein n=1 Tax=Flavobacterium rivuli TaxID=498301 RepID=UPI0003AA3F9D|nr:hypothetical protein [Flavobacterium rivuli]